VDSNQISKVYTSLFKDFPPLIRGWEWGHLVARVNQDRMTLISTLLPDQILHAEYSPDGSRILTGEMDGSIRLWDARTGRQLLERRPHTAGVWAARFSRDGSRILTSSFDHTGLVLDSVLLREIQTLPTHRDILRGGSISPDGKLALSVSRDTLARLVRISDGEVLWTHSNETTRLYDSDFHPSGELVVVAGNRSALILSVADGRIVKSLPTHPGNILGVRFSPDGRMLATACADRVLRVFDTETGALVFQSVNDGAYLHSVAWSPDGSMLATGDDEGRLSLWDATDGRNLGSAISRSSMYKVGFSPDGRQVVVATAVTCQVFDVDRVLGHQESRILTGPDVGATINLTGSTVGRLRVYSSPYERIGAWPGYDRLWRVPAGRREVRQHGYRIFVDSYYTALRPDSEESLEIDPVALTVTRRNLRDLQQPAQKVPVTDAYWAEYSPSGKQAVILSVTQGVVTFDTTDWNRQWNIPADTIGPPTTSTRFGGRAIYTPDGRTMAIGSHSGTVLVVDADTGELRHGLTSPSGSNFNIAISNDGTLLATGGLSDKVNIWDLESGDLLTTMSGLEKFVVALAFSPDDKRLLTGTNDDRIRLWDTQSGREIMQLDYLKGQEILVGLGFTPDGRAAIAADSYGKIHLYEAFPYLSGEYPGTEEDPPQMRLEWLKRSERIGTEITREDVAKFLKYK
jgi:WD40 repeat protein